MIQENSSKQHCGLTSPGVKDGAVEQSAVEVVTHKIGAHH